MPDRPPYESPTAFRRALTDRLKELAKTSRWTLPQLQRQFAYDRLLERLYLVDDGWIVKGATALLAREIGVRGGTIDVDIYRNAASEVAEAELRQAADTDIGDWFRFETGPSQPVRGVPTAFRIPVTSYIGTAVWQPFGIDLVGADVAMTGEPEDVPALARVLMPNVEQHGYRVYPLVDHIADKIAAMFQRFGDGTRPSTRFRDLVDLVAIVGEVSVDAELQQRAIAAQSKRRGLTLPKSFGVPDTRLWETGYAAEARRSVLLVASTLNDALDAVKPFIDALLDGTAFGRWDPKQRKWTL